MTVKIVIKLHAVNIILHLEKRLAVELHSYRLMNSDSFLLNLFHQQMTNSCLTASYICDTTDTWYTLALDGFEGCLPTRAPARCTKYNNPPIKGQCTSRYNGHLV